VVTGRVEADYEGDFTNQNSVNISSPRNGQLRTRLAWARLDTKVADSLPIFWEFGQDWTLYSSTLPSLFETTGTAISMGALWERAPMFRTGVQFHAGDLKIQPEFAYRACRCSGYLSRSPTNNGHGLATGPAQKATSQP